MACIVDACGPCRELTLQRLLPTQRDPLQLSLATLESTPNASKRASNAAHAPNWIMIFTKSQRFQLFIPNQVIANLILKFTKAT